MALITKNFASKVFRSRCFQVSAAFFTMKLTCNTDASAMAKMSTEVLKAMSKEKGKIIFLKEDYINARKIIKMTKDPVKAAQEFTKQLKTETFAEIKESQLEPNHISFEEFESIFNEKMNQNARP